jgi:hypothetical protein
MEGIFNKNSHGHMGLFSGTLEKITRFQLWENPEEPNQTTDTPDKN